MFLRQDGDKNRDNTPVDSIPRMTVFHRKDGKEPLVQVIVNKGTSTGESDIVEYGHQQFGGFRYRLNWSAILAIIIGMGFLSACGWVYIAQFGVPGA